MATPQVPAHLLRRAVRIVRPRDLSDVYVNPTAELTRLENQGAAIRLARGYYVLVPARWIGRPAWRPTIEATALALAIADYAVDQVALMGPSAARNQGGLPRAVAIASVAVPKQRPALPTPWGEIVFHKRDVSRLDLERVDTELAGGYQTTVEQTILDLARWADTWRLSVEMIAEAITSLAGQADWVRTRDLAIEQHERVAYVRARWVAHPVVPDAPRLDVRGSVKSLALRPMQPVAQGEFPIDE